MINMNKFIENLLRFDDSYSKFFTIGKSLVVINDMTIDEVNAIELFPDFIKFIIHRDGNASDVLTIRVDKIRYLAINHVEIVKDGEVYE